MASSIHLEEGIRRDRPTADSQLKYQFCGQSHECGHQIRQSLLGHKTTAKARRTEPVLTCNGYSRFRSTQSHLEHGLGLLFPRVTT